MACDEVSETGPLPPNGEPLSDKAKQRALSRIPVRLPYRVLRQQGDLSTTLRIGLRPAPPDTNHGGTEIGRHSVLTIVNGLVCNKPPTYAA